jgi:murein DD-endopeptidase MepM/ murein hydrolase activator NlpD
MHLFLSLSLCLCLPAATAVLQKPARGKGEAPEAAAAVPEAPAEKPFAVQGDLVLHLPFEAGKSFTCQRAPSEARATESPELRYVVDLALPRGTPVVAAATGIVVEVEQDWELSGEREALEPFANRVTIDHGGGRFTRYLHLSPRSAVVKEGEIVLAGARLALSGDTGRTVSPKLRFVFGDVWGRSAPLRFAELKDGVPVEKEACLSKNEDPAKAKPAAKKAGSRMLTAKDREREKEKEKEAAATTEVAPVEPSSLPEDAFAFNQIELSNALPANVFDEDWTYVLSGRVTDDSRRVVLFLNKRSAATGNVAFFITNVTDQRTFALPICLSDFRDKLAGGSFKYALATCAEDGTFQSAKMLPLVIRRK